MHAPLSTYLSSQRTRARVSYTLSESRDPPLVEIDPVESGAAEDAFWHLGRSLLLCSAPFGSIRERWGSRQRHLHRRIRWVVGVEYRTTVEQLKYIRDEIEAWLIRDARFATPPEAPLFVRIDTFNASSIDFLIYAFTRTTNWGEWLEIKEEFAFAIMQIIERAGTGFAFPSQTVYLRQEDPPEIMAPPVRSNFASPGQSVLPDAAGTRGFGESDGGG